MKFLLIILAIIATSCATQPTDNQQSKTPPKNVTPQISDTQSRYELLDMLARKCGAYIDMNGLAGSTSEYCTKFKSNLSSGFLKETTDSCAKLIKWYSETKVTHPTIADKHFDDIHYACSIGNYPNISLTANKLKNIKKLK